MNDTLIVFLIPLASRSVKSNWKVACAHLRQTLRSIQNSSCDNYRVVVASHEEPDGLKEFDSKFVFLRTNHDIPVNNDHFIAGRLDKLAKYELAWKYAKSVWQPRYLMKLDADDLISSRLVDWLTTSGDAPGYLVQRGWIWSSGARFFIRRTKALDRICGSCLIIRGDFADKPGPFLTNFDGALLDKASLKLGEIDQYSLIPGSAVSTLLLNNCHQRYAAQFNYLGASLSSVPFNAVTYRIHNPDSITKGKRHTHTMRMWLGGIRRTRLITPRLRREFLLK